MKSLKIFIETLLDYIWPKFCLACQKEGALLCNKCLTTIPLLDLDYRPWPVNNFYFKNCYVCLDYHLPITQKLIKNFKYKYFSQLDNYLVDILARFAQQLNLPADTIITNPSLHTRRRQQRGFDQTQLLALGLANRLRLKYYSLLTRQKPTKAQAKLDKIQRLDNIIDAFKLNPKVDLANISPKQTILIIDDVATTGSTLNEAAKTLNKAGFYNIICLVLAKN